MQQAPSRQQQQVADTAEQMARMNVKEERPRQRRGIGEFDSFKATKNNMSHYVETSFLAEKPDICYELVAFKNGYHRSIDDQLQAQHQTVLIMHMFNSK